MDFITALLLSSSWRVTFIDISRSPWEPWAAFITAAVVLLSRSAGEQRAQRGHVTHEHSPLGGETHMQPQDHPIPKFSLSLLPGVCLEWGCCKPFLRVQCLPGAVGTKPGGLDG